jgi:hypothetical protein
VRATQARMPAGDVRGARLTQSPVMPGGRGDWSLLALALHLPPSAVPLVGDVRFCRSAQRLARLT